MNFNFTLFKNFVPAVTVNIAAVEAEHRSLGMGLTSIVYRVFGTIPGPIVFGVSELIYFL